MSAVLVSYDLNRPRQNYKGLYDALKGVGSNWWHYLDSTWVLAGYGLTPGAVYDAVAEHLDGNDTVLAVEITRQSRQGWLPAEAWKWLDEHA